MRLFKKIIKSLAKNFLTQKEITEIIFSYVPPHDEQADWEEIRDLFTKIFNENPRFKKYIILRKNMLLNSALDGDKSYISGAISELNIMENLYKKNEEEVKIKKEDSKISIENFLNFFKGRD